MNKMAVCIIAVFAMPVGAAYAIDHPQMKEGLWQIRTQTIDNPGGKKSEGTVTVCRDHAFDKSAEALAKTIKGCGPMNESFSGGKYSAQLRCEIAGSVMISKGDAVYQGDTSAHSETHVTYTPAMYGMADETMIQDQKYLGSCPAGMKPGDRKSEDGSITHLGNR